MPAVSPLPLSDPRSLLGVKGGGSKDAGARSAIWFAQVVGREIRIIDYYESSGVELAHYVRELQKRDYLYAGHIVPHDARAKELGTGKSRIELMQSLGLRSITLAPSHFVEDGIEAVRVFLPKCWFDAQRCARGIDALGLVEPTRSTRQRA
jgi:phage terminase large subunit